MKKLASLVLVLVCVFACLFGLTSCDPGRNVLNIDELLANTVKIELVNYENNNPNFIRNLNGKKKPTFDFNKATLIATLDDSKIEDVVKDLENTAYLYYNRALNEPIGKTLILYQSNGDMLVFYDCIYTNEKGSTYYYDGCIMFDKDGKYIEYIGDFANFGLDAIIPKYFAATTDSNTSS